MNEDDVVTFEDTIIEIRDYLDETINRGCKIDDISSVREMLACELDVLERIYRSL